MSLGDFFKLLEDGGPHLNQASHLLQVYAKEQNREMLKDYFFQDDRRVDSALLALDDAARVTVRTSTAQANQVNMGTDRR